MLIINDHIGELTNISCIGYFLWNIPKTIERPITLILSINTEHLNNTFQTHRGQEKEVLTEERVHNNKDIRSTTYLEIKKPIKFFIEIWYRLINWENIKNFKEGKITNFKNQKSFCNNAIYHQAEICSQTIENNKSYHNKTRRKLSHENLFYCCEFCGKLLFNKFIPITKRKVPKTLVWI